MRTPLFCLLLLTAACTPVGPDYQQPEVAVPARFAEGTAGQIGEVATRQWWTQYQDRMLSDLVARGLRQNLSIAASLERIRAAEASLRASGGASAVSGDLAASSTRAGGDNIPATQSNSGSLSANVALDLFGGVRRGAQSAAADLEAAKADEGTVRLAYLSSIVGAYIDARYYQEALALTRQTIALREETLNLTLAKVQAGTAAEYEEVQIRALLDAAKAELPGMESSYLAQVYTIATLLGEPAEPLQKQMQSGRAQPRPRGKLSTGVPAELLRNRPDVRAAEQALVAATADVGVAEADLLPSITLGGSVAGGGGRNWSFGPQISMPVLSQPRLRANRDRAISLARQAEIDWRSTILSAVEDVQASYSKWTRLQREVSLREQSVSSYARAATLSRQAYDVGSITLSELLDDDRSLASARLSLASSVRNLAIEWATVQISLGAGAYAGAPR